MQIQPRKPSSTEDHADCTALTSRHELDRTNHADHVDNTDHTDNIFSCVLSPSALLRFSRVGRAQASLLKRLVTDTAGLVKLTGSFYDRYSDTHRARAAASTAAAGAVPPVVISADGGFAGNKFLRKFGYGYHRETDFGGDYGTDSGSHAVGGARGAMGPRGAKRYDASDISGASAMLNPPRSVENSGNNLDRTAEYGAGRAHAGFDGAAVRELDRRCYSLLEANAQLCLRLQGLGLEYAGLTREMLDSGPKLVSNRSLHQVSEKRKRACQRNRNAYVRYNVCGVIHVAVVSFKNEYSRFSQHFISIGACFHNRHLSCVYGRNG